jgi:hypothetical protein
MRERLTPLVEPVKCAGCVRVVERRKWCCVQCWSALPRAVCEAIVRCADHQAKKLDRWGTAAKCQRILERQAVQFWRGASPRGFLWSQEGMRL